ncbi:hypothetical protein K8I31_19985 [bacterium]|nr:hypothetical protein [bacterium]
MDIQRIQAMYSAQLQPAFKAQPAAKPIVSQFQSVLDGVTPQQNSNPLEMLGQPYQPLNDYMPIRPVEDLSQTQEKNSAVWEQISEQYDVRDMSLNDMQKMSQSLYDQGAIGLFDHAIMSFDQSRINEELGLDPPQNDHLKKDWIELFEKDVDTQKENGNQQNVENLERILGYLHKIDDAKSK